METMSLAARLRRKTRSDCLTYGIFSGEAIEPLLSITSARFSGAISAGCAFLA